MLKFALVFFSIGIAIILFLEKRNNLFLPIWVAGILCWTIAMIFLIAGMLTKKRLNDDSHQSLP